MLCVKINKNVDHNKKKVKKKSIYLKNTLYNAIQKFGVSNFFFLFF